jgi:hypothetical protein
LEILDTDIDDFDTAERYAAQYMLPWLDAVTLILALVRPIVVAVLNTMVGAGDRFDVSTLINRRMVSEDDVQELEQEDTRYIDALKQESVLLHWLAQLIHNSIFPFEHD